MKKSIFAILLFLIFILFASVTVKLYQLQIVEADKIEINYKFERILPLRGNIYLKDKDNNLYPLALSFYTYDLYFYPPKAKNIEEEINKLFSIISKEKAIKDLNFLIESAKQSSQSILLAKEIEEQEKERLETLKLDSIFFEEKVKRTYPQKNVLSTIIGFARLNSDSGLLEGQYGLEKYYDEILRGEIGYRKDINIFKNPRKGGDLILNIDYYVQKKIEQILKNKIEEYSAQGGLIIVVDNKSGNILGLAEYPNYDPNEFNKISDYSLFISRISKNYEPGSVMKPFFYAGAFEENLVTPETKYEDKGFVILNNKRIENFDGKGRGVIDLKTALEQSLNTGSVYISQILGKARFLKYVDKFRLNKKAEIDFNILEEPNFHNLKDPGREINFGTASYGQGVAISPLNLIQGFMVFANKGTMLKLNFVKQIEYFDGSKDIVSPQIIEKRILKFETIQKILPILEGVVENQAKKAKIKGYSVGGKTGSALIPIFMSDAKGKTNDNLGYTDDVITTFIGFFPVSDPRFIVLVRLDKPAKGYLSFGTAAPTFKLVADFLISYYNLDPDKPYEVLSGIKF